MSNIESRIIYPAKIYTSLQRACRYGGVLPNFVQPVFKADREALTFECVGFAIGPQKDGNVWLSYFKD